MKNIVEDVLSSYGREVGGPTKQKLLNYVRLLASTGLAEDQLLAFGKAYLKETLQPDPRYTGC